MESPIDDFLQFVFQSHEQGLLRDPQDIIFKFKNQFISLGADCSLNSPDENSLIIWDVDEHSGLSQRLSMYKKLFKLNKKYCLAMFSKAPYTQGFSRTGRSLYPLLDDMAQIAGSKIPSTTEDQILKKIKHRNMLFIKDLGCLCLSHDFYELQAMALVAEKASRAEIESYFIGGGKPIAFHEAILMKGLYDFKYSRMKKKN